MTQIITATFEDGVLKPNQPLRLPARAQVRVTVELLQSDIQAEWDATKEQRLAALENLLRMRKIHSTEPHLTRDQLHERR